MAAEASTVSAYGGLLALHYMEKGGKYVSIDNGRRRRDSKHLALIKELVEAGHTQPVMDRCYLLEGIVEAHRYTVRRGCMSTTSRS